MLQEESLKVCHCRRMRSVVCDFWMPLTVKSSSEALTEKLFSPLKIVARDTCPNKELSHNFRVQKNT